MASDYDSESSTIDDPPIFPKDDLPSPPCSLVSRVSGEGATFEGTAFSSAATSSTPRSNLLEDMSIPTKVDQHPDLSKLFSITY